jgi:hypothetical protein
MLKRRGMTLVEMSLALTLTALVIGVLTALYGFTMVRLEHATADFAASDDAFLSANDISTVVGNAYSCTAVTSNGITGLKCTMPANGSDKDNDGHLDTWAVSSVSRRGLERVTLGKRVWFYLGNSTGAFGTTGTILWKAERSDDLNPTSSDAITKYAYVTSTRLRYPLISSLTFTVTASAQTVALTVVAGSLIRAERLPASESTNQAYTHTENRTVYWRNWRK